MSERIGVTILGSTGSIGVSTLDVLQRHADRFRVVALTATGMLRRCFSSVWLHESLYAVMADLWRPRLRDRLQRWGDRSRCWRAWPGLERVAALPETDYVMAAIVGAAGLVADTGGGARASGCCWPIRKRW
jgi:1-deoxy-D-xylulose-5-phosphate reductoisomerase